MRLIAEALGDEELDDLEVEEHHAARPSLPLLLLSAAAMWCGIRLARALCWQAYASGGGVLIVLQSAASDLVSVLEPRALILAVALAVALALLGRIEWRRGAHELPRQRANVSQRIARREARESILTVVVLIVAGLALGLIAGSLCYSHLSSSISRFPTHVSKCRMVVTDDVSSGDFGATSTAVVYSEDGVALNVRVGWGDFDPLPLGSECTVYGDVHLLDDSSGSEYRFKQLIGATFRPRKIEDVAWAHSLQGLFGELRFKAGKLLSRFGGDGAALLSGIVLGNREEVGKLGLGDPFRLTGLAHLLAVSGSHLSIVIALSTLALSRPRLPKGAKVAILAAACISYLGLTGMHESAIRACAMSLAANVAWLAGRRRHSLSALTLAVVAMLAVDPSCAYSMGFVLSVLAVFGLCVFTPLVSEWIESLSPRSLRKASTPLAMALTAQACTSPVAIPAFATLSMLGPFCNILAAPAIALLLGFGMISLLAAAIFAPVGNVLLGAACLLAEGFCAIVRFIASLPLCAIPFSKGGAELACIALALGAAVWIAWPLPSRRSKGILVAALAALLGFGAVAALWPSPSRLVALDVGQGDAILVADGGVRLLVDTGREDSKLLAALSRNKAYSLDAVLITHFDEDHCGSLSALSPTVPVEAILVADGCLSCDDPKATSTLRTADGLAREGVFELSCGSRIKISEHIELEMIWPTEEVDGCDNEDSICLLMRYDADLDGEPEITALLTGDAESEQLESMVASGLGSIDILKVGHHGSAASITPELAEKLGPKASLISVGEGNAYGHPSYRVIDALVSAGSKVLRTDLQGDIVVTLTQKGAAITYDGR
ncbi:MAG: DNA internalization-related competence protein ComEC/Rec2 [bacterium]|nr:DNA internalization-related competence protein ComEC/Rec2 [bacterium]